MTEIRPSLKRLLIVYVFIGIFCSFNAYSANWQPLGEIPESPKFGKTDYYVDIESISRDGNIRTVWLKSVFSKPQPYEEDKTYTSLLSFAHYNCSNKTYSVTRIDVYNADGELVGSEKQDVNYVPIPEGSLDDKMYEFVCSYKK
jgi:hypothetical protein